jgi:hypothetical protein
MIQTVGFAKLPSLTLIPEIILIERQLRDGLHAAVFTMV